MDVCVCVCVCVKWVRGKTVYKCKSVYVCVCACVQNGVSCVSVKGVCMC